MRMRMRMTIIIKIFFFKIKYKNELLLGLQTRNLRKSKEQIFKIKAAEYYVQNKEVIKKRQEIILRTCQKKKKQNQRVSKEKVSRIDSIQKRF